MLRGDALFFGKLNISLVRFFARLTNMYLHAAAKIYCIVPHAFAQTCVHLKLETTCSRKIEGQSRSSVKWLFKQL